MELLVIQTVLVTASMAKADFGLTTYGEPCTDSCKQRGFPYAWCHKKASWNGTYLSKLMNSFNDDEGLYSRIRTYCNLIVFFFQTVITVRHSSAKLDI